MRGLYVWLKRLIGSWEQGEEDNYAEAKARQALNDMIDQRLRDRGLI